MQHQRLIDNAVSRLKLSNGEKLVLYILRNTDGNTKIFNQTYKEIQNNTGISQATIATVLRALESNGTLIRAGRGQWFVPAVIGYEDDGDEATWALMTESR